MTQYQYPLQNLDNHNSGVACFMHTMKLIDCIGFTSYRQYFSCITADLIDMKVKHVALPVSEWWSLFTYTVVYTVCWMHLKPIQWNRYMDMD